MLCRVLAPAHAQPQVAVLARVVAMRTDTVLGVLKMGTGRMCWTLGRTCIAAGAAAVGALV